jgi:hypothetical protein
MNFSGGNANGITNNMTYDAVSGSGQSISVSGISLSTIQANNPLLGTNPNLANLSSNPRDFHPLAGSPALGAGATDVTTQFALSTPDGLGPTSPPNIGAFNVLGGVPPPPGVPGPVSIAGGSTTAFPPYIADAGFTGGQTITNNPTAAVDTSLVAIPAPVGVYRSERYGTFSYIIWDQLHSKS